MTTSSFSVANILPDLNINGAYQRFILGNIPSPPPLGSFKIDNIYVPLVGSPSFTNSEIRNSNLSGYRWIHETQTTDSNGYGSLTLQKFLTASSTGVNLITFNDNGTFSIPGSTDAKYIIQTAAANLPNAQVLGSLSSGIIKNTTTTGVLSIATNGTDYYSPGNPTTITTDSINQNVSLSTNAFASISGATGNAIFNVVGGQLLTSGTGNCFFAAINAQALTTGSSNVFIANLAGNAVTTGSSNILIGTTAGENITTANFNVFIGASCAQALSTGASNTGVGTNSGTWSGGGSATYDHCVFVGNNATTTTSNITNGIAIGNNSSVAASNTIVMGNSSITNFNIPGLNFGLTANTITSTNTNGNITVTPNGTGIISLSSNVGIGTTTANSPLQFSNSTNNRIITLLEGTNNTHQYYGFGTQTNTLVYNVAGTSNIHAFYCGTSSSASQELMRITATGTTSNSGCVGINVGATPSAGCHVVGGVQNVTNEDSCIRASSSSLNAKIELQNTTVSTGKLYEIRSSSTGVFDITDRTASATKLIINATGTGIAGVPDTNFSVTTGTADKPGGGTWGSFSDARIKNVLHDYKQGLNEILKINPIVYKYSEDSKLSVEDQEIIRIGIVAQHIEEIMPECITSREARGFSDLRFYDESPIIYAVINAIKELSAKMDELEGK
jgi:hypothetical protein